MLCIIPKSHELIEVLSVIFCSNLIFVALYSIKQTIIIIIVVVFDDDDVDILGFEN